MGLFAIVMTLASGAYLLMVAANRQAQAISTGIDNLSFALEEMTRTIRTGTGYSCAGGGDCASGASSLTLTDQNGSSVTYALSSSAIVKTKAGSTSTLTDPSVSITKLTFYVSGSANARAGDYQPPHATIVITGTASAGPGKTESFDLETGATMRGTDL
jgi:hypothetical protein